MSFLLKVCLSKGGLTRRIKTKHRLETAEPNTEISEMLDPAIFYELLQNSLKQLAQDEWFPEELSFATLE